jgi:hypothetical protein
MDEKDDGSVYNVVPDPVTEDENAPIAPTRPSAEETGAGFEAMVEVVAGVAEGSELLAGATEGLGGMAEGIGGCASGCLFVIAAVAMLATAGVLIAV